MLGVMSCVDDTPTSSNLVSNKVEDRRANGPGQPIFIDAFAGCGGLSLGLLRSGWHGLFAIEKDLFAFEP